MRTHLIFILAYFILINAHGQNKIRFDKSLTPDKIVCADTLYWFDNNDTTGQKLIAYPNNSKMTLFGDTIPNCQVILRHDTLFISIFKLTYGLRVYLDLTYINGSYSTTLIYDQSNI